MAIRTWVFSVAVPLVILLSLELSGLGMFARKDRSPSGSFGPADSLAFFRKKPTFRTASRNGSARRCDIFEGTWVRDHTYPLYQPGSCPYVEEAFSCRENGRPDSNYTSWRWKPADCEIPRFNATDMLRRLRDKRLVFVGDSLSRNQWESMMCLLREGVADKSRVFEVNGESITKHKGSFVFQFLDYNCYVEYYGSHFLMAEEPKEESRSLVDSWEDSQRERRNFYWEGDVILGRLDVKVALWKAMKTWVAWVYNFVNPEKTRVFFSGYSPAHFRGGGWNSGGGCQEEIEPIFNESHLPKIPKKARILEDALSLKDFPVKLLNLSRLSSYRKDAHPSVYGLHMSPEDVPSSQRYQDCSHWCLPGVPDVWNELLYAMMDDTD